MLELSEEAVPFSEIVQAMIRAQKTLKMYPSNNPTYIRAVDDVFSRIQAHVDTYGDLILHFGHKEILSEGMKIYENDSRQDNFALFFFRDGIREVSFRAGIQKEELLHFLTIISKDFDRQFLDDDIVTLLWEKDFQHIGYEATDEFLLEDEYDASIEERSSVPAATKSEELLAQAYEDAVGAQTVHADRDDIAALTEQDRLELDRLKEIEESASPLPNLIATLVDMLRDAKKPEDFEETVDFLSGTMQFCLRRADFDHAFQIFRQVEELTADPKIPSAQKLVLKRVSQSVGRPEIIDEMGEILDSEIPVSGEGFVQCAPFFDTPAIPPLMDLLGRLETMRARRILIEVLAVLGRRNMAAINRGLRDKRWFVVRNTLHILGKINDPRSVETLGQCIRHTDPRVRKEAFRVMGQLGSPKILPHLKTGLADMDPAVRVIAVKAFRGFGKSDVARRLVMEEIGARPFSSKEFQEKKEFFQVLAQWDNSDDVLGFLQKTLTRRSLLQRNRSDELRACAAVALGLVKDPEPFVPYLQEAASNGGRLLKNAATEALRRIKEHGRDRQNRSSATA